MAMRVTGGDRFPANHFPGNLSPALRTTFRETCHTCHPNRPGDRLQGSNLSPGIPPQNGDRVTGCDRFPPLLPSRAKPPRVRAWGSFWKTAQPVTHLSPDHANQTPAPGTPGQSKPVTRVAP